MRVLLVSSYELGHQPLHVASPAGSLRRAGHDVRCLDLSVDPYDPELVAWADAIAFSVPMHTAMRLALRAAQRVKRDHTAKPVCFFGLYAPVSRELTVGVLADRVIAGEYEAGLARWVDELGDSGAAEPMIQLGHDDFATPARDLLPPLGRYAHLAYEGEERLVGYVEASHGCAHECRHCPVPVIYGGRIRLVPRDVVLDDIAQLVDAGARHITFGDPDFLNGWRHSLQVVEEMHRRWPELTFDCTTKVEHVLERADLWQRLKRAGCLFVVSAFECVNDSILERLDKGHVTAQAVAATELLRAHDISVRPSFMPFTPWTTPSDVLEVLDFVVRHDLIANVDPVQYTIRLLLPEGSLLLEHPDIQPYLGSYDPELLTYRWRAADPRSDELQAELAALVEQRASSGEPAGATFLAVYEAAARAAGLSSARPPADPIAAGSVEGRPRLTEPWFC